jgi:uncharacterized protein (TIGR02300 family)
MTETELMAATADLGNKFRCFQCGTKFYDLHKAEAICPKCKANQKNAPPEAEQTKITREQKRIAEEVEEVEAPEADVAGDEDEAPAADDENLGGEEEEESDFEEY